MAVPVKVILLPANDTLGTGLTALRTYEDQAIDISEFSDAVCGDATSTGTFSYVIKNDVAYRIFRSYFDLDRNCRYLVAKCENNRFDKWPVG